MLFSSFTFLFAFLPITAVLYFLKANRTYRNAVLLIASLVFYAWGEPSYIVVMLVMILVNWLIGLGLQRQMLRTPLLVVGILFDLCILGYFKYANFAVYNLNAVLHTQIPYTSVALPIGISFYTFQILSYLFDVYFGKVEVQKNLFLFACYVSLFPQLIAGPIVRYRDIAEDLYHRKESWRNAEAGIRRFLFGLGKKILLANNMAIIADRMFALGALEVTFMKAWLGAIAFMLQIYYDFSGYSDMAIGLGKLFGFRFLENFNQPYRATSVTDFWRRWHMSLSSWFRDYVYIPLGGSRKGLARQILNLLVVWTLTGLWHGAAWNFVLWGLWFFFWLVIEKLFLLKHLDQLKILNHVYCLLVVLIGWVIFNASSLAKIKVFITSMFSKPVFESYLLIRNGWLPLMPVLVASVLFCTPFTDSVHERIKKDNAEIAWNLISFAILAMCIVLLVNDTYNPFIYFRF